MTEPLSVFIASASEGVDVAHAVRDFLKKQGGFLPRAWDEDEFQKSYAFIESIEEALDKSDFAIVTFTPDDLTSSRQRMFMTPRDNVVFELGYAMGRLGRVGRLGRERAYFVWPKNGDLKIPSDLLGVEGTRFRCDQKSLLPTEIAGACESLVGRMRTLGPREKRTVDEEEDARVATRFCRHVAGSWWQHVTTKDLVRLSFVSLAPDLPLSTVALGGPCFDREGLEVARWRSMGVGIRPKERTIVYSWSGQQGSDDMYTGFGKYEFYPAPSEFQGGNGIFADIHKQTETRWKAVELRRVDGADLEETEAVMHTGSVAARKSMVLKVLAKFVGSTGGNG